MSVDGCQSGNTFSRTLKRRVTEFVKWKTERTKQISTFLGLSNVQACLAKGVILLGDSALKRIKFL